MLLIPAIDLKDGKCVRLKQGRMDDDTVYSDDPVAVAARWVEAGARRLHVVDLDGGGAGTPHDVIDVRDAGFADMTALFASTSEVNGDTVISIDANQSITLTGVSLQQLTADHFIIA